MAMFLPLHGETFPEASPDPVAEAFAQGFADAGGVAGAATTGAILPVVVTPEVIRELKERLDATAKALDHEASTCSALTAERLAAWKLFYAAWRSYADADPPSFFSFGMGGLYDTGIAFEGQLASWQKTIDGAGCTPGAPPLVRQGDENTKSEDTLKLFAYGALAVGLGVVLIGLRK